MKKSILNIGKVLSRAEQKIVFGGNIITTDDGDSGWCSHVCSVNADCGPMQECFTGKCDGDDTRMCRAA